MNRDFKYKKLLSLLITQINNHVIHEKLPSVRWFAKEHNVSVSTVLQAYGELERLGRVVSEPKRGYFVQSNKRNCTNVRHDYGDDIISVKSGKDIFQTVQYSLNDSDLLPLSSTAPSSVVSSEKMLTRLARKALTHNVFELSRQDPVSGLPELKRALCQHWFNFYADVLPEQLVICSGRIQALQTVLVALNAKNKSIAAESPMSFYFRSGLTPLNIDVIEIPQQQSYQYEIELLDKAYCSTPFDVFLVNPSFNDPTGRLLAEQDKLELLSWANRRKVTIVEYDRSSLHFFGIKPLSLAELAIKYSFTDLKLVSIGDFFDTIAPTFSLGYLICLNCAEQIKLTKQVTSEPPEILMQKILVNMLESGKYGKHVSDVRRGMRTNYKKCLSIIDKEDSEHYHFSTVEGGPCLWIKLAEPNSAEKLWKEALTEKVAIAPGVIFSFAKSYDNYFRITFALPFNQTMEEGLNKLHRLLLLRNIS